MPFFGVQPVLVMMKERITDTVASGALCIKVPWPAS